MGSSSLNPNIAPELTFGHGDDDWQRVVLGVNRPKVTLVQTFSAGGGDLPRCLPDFSARPHQWRLLPDTQVCNTARPQYPTPPPPFSHLPAVHMHASEQCTWNLLRCAVSAAMLIPPAPRS